MKFLATAHPKANPPLMEAQQMVNLHKAALAWMEQQLRSGELDLVYGFVPMGGFAIMEADDVEHVMQKILDYPLEMFFTWEVKPLIDIQTSVKLSLEHMERMFNPA